MSSKPESAFKCLVLVGQKNLPFRPLAVIPSCITGRDNWREHLNRNRHDNCQYVHDEVYLHGFINYLEQCMKHWRTKWSLALIQAACNADNMITFHVSRRVNIIGSIHVCVCLSVRLSFQGQVPICGWLMAILWCVTLSGYPGWLLRCSNSFLYTGRDTLSPMPFLLM